MIEGVIIKKINKYTDDRGWLAEVYRSDEIDFVPQMSYLSYTKFGVKRGPHEHLEQSDYFVFAGPGDFMLYLWDNRPSSSSHGEHLEITVGESDPTLVIVPPGVVHGYKCVSENGAFSINLPDKLYKGKDKQLEIDEVRHENDPSSPYQIN
ncbi:MAG TPA: dTDP-4-dehydrorhamnose 3,5-epimerase family protein [bacterium]|nr:dTDP-4-dehydrorhamnose 3,5-epimerase family protein [bacterium]HPT30101.1 dTDP-4-dehydrorhamnose 3,5-epimerase family protein [bacterium]